MHFLIYLCLLLVTPFAGAYPEKGKWTFPVDQNAGVVGVTKSLQAGSQITVKSEFALLSSVFFALLSFYAVIVECCANLLLLFV